MQGFMGRRSIHPSLVAGGATALVECAAILRRDDVRRPEQKRGEADRAGEGAKRRIFHIRDGFYHVGLALLPPEGFCLSPCTCYLKASATVADLINGVVYESVIHTITAFPQRFVPAGAI